MTTLSDVVNAMIIDVLLTTVWTSAGGRPDVSNTVQSIGQTTNPDLESIISSTLIEAGAGGGMSGTGGAITPQSVFSSIKNPEALAKRIIGTLPFIGGIVAAAEFGEALLAELKRIDEFFKVFIPDITNLHDQLRSREEAALVAVGDQQKILSVRAGQTSPRLSYNSYNGFNTASVRGERLKAIRDNSGI